MLEIKRLLLPLDRADLYKTVQDIPYSGGDQAFGLYIVTSILLKEVATIYRIHKQNSSLPNQNRLNALEDYLSSIQLALSRHPRLSFFVSISLVTACLVFRAFFASRSLESMKTLAEGGIEPR